MKKSLLVLLLAIVSQFANAQCNTTNGTSCLCPTGIDTCDLYPDLRVTESLLYSAELNPEVLGELRISVSTPNIGFGPLQVLSSNYFVCGEDTLYSPGGMSGTCPDGTYPRQLVKQKVYRKEGNGMINYERWAGSMTYHPTHGHMHVDNWCIFSIRTPIQGVDNPLEWPIVAEGAKTGFCLMDYGSCNYYNGYCVNDNDQVVTSANQVNYGLGGGEYSCGFDQGISAGFTDIYHHYLEGMGIPIPAGVCNGDYYLVVVVDPDNHFIETNETNNVTAVPITLTKQNVEPTNIVNINGPTTFCRGESLELQATAGESYIWSTGETTPNILVTESGTYHVNIQTACSTIVSAPINVEVLDAKVDAISADIETVVCTPTPVTITAEAEGEVNWYDSETAIDPLFTGNTFVTPEISENTTYYVENTRLFEGAENFNEPHDNAIGNGGLNGAVYNGYMIFDSYKPFILKSIKVYTTGAGDRTFQVRNSAGDILQQLTVFVPDGESRVILNMDVPTGTDLQLGTAAHPNMYRNNTGVIFPYITPGLLSIKASNYDDPANSAYYYYYFYDWEVQEYDFTCTGIRTPVTISYENCVGLNQSVNSNQFSCTIAPNPNQGSFSLSIDSKVSGDYDIRLYNIAGKLVYHAEQFNARAFTHQFNMMNKLPQGIYMLSVSNGEQLFNEKVIVR